MSAPPPSVHTASPPQRSAAQRRASRVKQRRESAPADGGASTRTHREAPLHASPLSVVSLLAAVQSADGPRVRALLHLAQPAPNDNDTTATAAAAVVPASSSPPADPNACDADGSSALHWAAWVKSRSCFSALLQAGGDPTRCNSRGESVLEWALRGGDLPLLAALLIRPDACAAVHSRNAFGGQPMHIAAEEGAVTAMAALAIMGAEMDARDARGKTPLMCAAHRNRPAAVQWLLRHDASASLCDNEQASALHYAAVGGNEFACSQILRQGQAAQLSVRAFGDRLTPQELAEKYGHTACAALLRRWTKQSSAVFNHLCVRTGLDPPSRTRPRLTGTQIYFFIGIALTLLHFSWHVQPVLSSYHGSGFAEDPAFFALLVGMWLLSLCGIVGMAGFMYLSPGMVPKNGATAGSNSTEVVAAYSTEWLVAQALSGAPVCVPCRIVKPIRSKHCEPCGGCVQRMDHHCPWVNGCVGAANHRAFFCVIISMLLAGALHAYLSFYFLFTIVLGTSSPAIAVSGDGSSGDGGAWAALGAEKLSILFLAHSILVTLGCLALLIGQSYTVAKGMTTNEAFNRMRYAYLANNGGASPFSQGVLGNCLAFWGIVPGRSFVRPGQGGRGASSFKLGARAGPSMRDGEDQPPGSVLLELGDLRQDQQQQQHAGHGHSHGGQACHGHGQGASKPHSHSHAHTHIDIPPASPSPPAPSGSLHLQALLNPPHGNGGGNADDGMEVDADCAYFNVPSHTFPQQQQLSPHDDHAHGQVSSDAIDLESTGLISGKDKHR